LAVFEKRLLEVAYYLVLYCIEADEVAPVAGELLGLASSALIQSLFALTLLAFTLPFLVARLLSLALPERSFLLPSHKHEFFAVQADVPHALNILELRKPVPEIYVQNFAIRREARRESVVDPIDDLPFEVGLNALLLAFNGNHFFVNPID